MFTTFGWWPSDIVYEESAVWMKIIWRYIPELFEELL